MSPVRSRLLAMHIHCHECERVRDNSLSIIRSFFPLRSSAACLWLIVSVCILLYDKTTINKIIFILLSCIITTQKKFSNKIENVITVIFDAIDWHEPQ